jgi:hypothetical protein
LTLRLRLVLPYVLEVVVHDIRTMSQNKLRFGMANSVDEDSLGIFDPQHGQAPVRVQY